MVKLYFFFTEEKLDSVTLREILVQQKPKVKGKMMQEKVGTMWASVKHCECIINVTSKSTAPVKHPKRHYITVAAYDRAAPLLCVGVNCERRA